MQTTLTIILIIIVLLPIVPFIYISTLTEERLEKIINKVEPLNQYMKLKIEVFLGNISSIEDTELAMNISSLKEKDYSKVYYLLKKAIKEAKKDKNELLYYQLISYFVTNLSLPINKYGTILHKLKLANFITILKIKNYIK